MCIHQLENKLKSLAVKKNNLGQNFKWIDHEESTTCELIGFLFVLIEFFPFLCGIHSYVLVLNIRILCCE